MENFTKANQHVFKKEGYKLCLRVKTKFKVNTIKAWLIMEKVIPIVKSVHYCIPNTIALGLFLLLLLFSKSRNLAVYYVIVRTNAKKVVSSK